jgi:hypothetical protein
LKINLRNPIHKKVGLTLLFYIVSGILIYLLNKIAPSGAHVPGLGVIAFFLLPVVSFILLLVNLFENYFGNKATIIPALIHITYIIVFVTYLKVL